METIVSEVEKVGQPVRQRQAGAPGRRRPEGDRRGTEDAPAHAETRPWTPEGFHVHDDATANWLVRKIRECRAYAARVTAWAAAETRRAQSEEQFHLERYGRQLEQWAATRLEGGKRRSIPLPAGTIGFRQHPPSLLLNDQKALFEWLAVNLPAAIRSTVEVTGAEAAALASWLDAGHCPGARVTCHAIRGVLRDHVRDTGDCPPGVQVASGTAFYVK